MVQNGLACALKISWQDADSEHEADALNAWQGDGAVELISFDRSHGALLLERLDETTDLESLSPDRALEVAGRLLRRLAIPAPAWARSLRTEAESLRADFPGRWEEAGRPFRRALMERACRTIEDLAPGAADLLVDVDLHYRNVLAGRREPWLAIDPKVVAGDPEYAAAALLWQPFTGIRARSDLDRKLAILTDAAGFDEQKARAWTFVRVVDYWLWAVEQGLTENLACCEALAGYLSGSAGE